MKNQKKYISKITSLCFVLPAVLVVVLLLLYPVCTSIFYSFTSKNLIKPVINLSVWRTMQKYCLTLNS